MEDIACSKADAYQYFSILWFFKLPCLFRRSLAFWYLCCTRGSFSSLLSSILQLIPLIYRPDLEDPTSDLFLSRIIMLTLSFEESLSECYPGTIFLSLSKVGKLSTSHTTSTTTYIIFPKDFR